MERRSVLARQKSLDYSQSREAIKVIEKYCRKKYGTSTLIPTNSLPHEYDANVTPEGFPSFYAQQSLSQQQLPQSKYSSLQSPTINIERPQSLFFTTPETTYNNGLHTPVTVAEIFNPFIKDEIKQHPEEKRSRHLWRVIKFIYKRFRLQNIAVVLIVVLYSLLGGAIFFYLEAPEEMRRHELHVKASIVRHDTFVQCYCLNSCSGWLQKYRTFSNKTLSHRLYKRSEENCLQVMNSMLKAYDVAAGYEPINKNIWAWNDYWNSVFYAWSLLTTIGYGNLSCRTILGRTATIFYALIGIPLMLVALNSLGKVCFSSVQHVWNKLHSKLKKKTKNLQKRIFLQRVQSMDLSNDDIYQKTQQELNEIDEEDDESDDTDDVDFFQTFPMHLALGIVFIYISMCSLIFSFWEEWDYFTAFYFFFISLSTIGLGDEVPQQPHYACIFFVFFVIGLALVSMCVSIMQARVENKYMAALMLIDEEHRNGMVNINETEILTNQLPQSEASPLLTQKFSSDRSISGIKWRRSPMMAHQLRATTEEPDVFIDDRHTSKSEDSDAGSPPRSPFNRMPSTSTLSGKSSTYSVPPPVLSALLSRRASTKPFKTRSLLRAETMTHVDTRERPNVVPLLEGTSSGNPHVDTPTTSSQIPAVFQRLSMFNAPLSVITEASDEDAKEQINKRRNSKLHPLDIQNEYE